MWSKIAAAAALAALLVSFGCGGGGSASITPPPPPTTNPLGQVTGLTTTASVGQIALAWTAVSGATGYSVSRATNSAGPFTGVATPTATSYSDTSATPGTTYYYQVTATNAGGSGPASATASGVAWGQQNVQITVNALADRHAISPLVYGVDFPPTAAYIGQTGTTFARWGGNASSRYNWKNFYANSANDWYFQDNGFQALGLGNSQADTGADSVQFTQDVVAAGAEPLLTLPMLSWVAKGGPTYYSFSVAKYGAQCATNPYFADDGDGLMPDCKTPITGNDPNDANVPLLDQPGTNDPAGSVYRNQWVQALAPAFGADPHFYDLGNEPDIWASTHRDVHPSPATYSELLNDFTAESHNLKLWDPKAIAFGPVSCCWEFYWNSAAGATDKQAHGNLDFWPWWVNDVEWESEIQGVSLLDVFDFHAYPEDNTPPTGASAAAIDAEALPSTRAWWDTSFVDSNSWIANSTVTQMQPLPNVEARLVRALATVHSINPELPVSVTEWNFGLTGEDPIANATTDAEGWGLLGRYNLYAAARWTAPDPTAEVPSLSVLQLYRNYDGKGSAFDPISVQATNDSANNTANPDDCGVFAAVNSAGNQMTLMVVNKSSYQQFQANLNLSGFTPSQVATYTVSTANSGQIVATPAAAFSPTVTFNPYSVTLLVVSGQAATVGAEWRLNPGIVMVPASGSVTLQPILTSATGSLTLGNFSGDSGITGSISQATVNTSQAGAVLVTAGSTPGFYHYTVTATDSAGATQTKDGIIEVGNPAATLAKTGDGQTAAVGSTVTLVATVNPGTSGASATGLDILFTASAGTLAPGGGNTLIAASANSTMLLETTDANGAATVTLTLPSTAGPATVKAEAPYPVGHPVATFTETAQ